MADNFLGTWLVSEYVYEQNGAFAGIVRQKRMLHRLENGNLRVTQQCHPEPSLDEHAMAHFAGEWVFDLAVDGLRRHYLGADVVGQGIQYVDGIMTGHGRWPRFGPLFESFGFLATPDQQITGGLFYREDTFVANIIGIAAQESVGTSWPQLPIAAATGQIETASLASIVGQPTYQAWLTLMQGCLEAALHRRLTELAAGMLQYSWQVNRISANDTQLSTELTVLDANLPTRAVKEALLLMASELAMAPAQFGDFVGNTLATFNAWHSPFWMT